jgi:putative DNA methylase
MTEDSHPVISPKKLIEVALPLDAINSAAEQEKNIKVGKPANLHHWWARRPMSAARGILFAQLVNDPEAVWRARNPNAEPNSQHRAAWTKARNRLFKIIGDLVRWENTDNPTIAMVAREAITESWRQTCDLNRDHPEAARLFNPDRMPPFHDPFAGGGAIPMEAQRLGLASQATDLNPVAALINMALIDAPARFSARGPVAQPKVSDGRLVNTTNSKTTGLTNDIFSYAQMVKEHAAIRVSSRYPLAVVTKADTDSNPELLGAEGRKLNVVAWIWARTIASPSPAFHGVHVPLVTTFQLCTKERKGRHVKVTRSNDSYSFTVAAGDGGEDAARGTKSARGANFTCVMSGVPIEPAYIKAEAAAGRLGVRLMAIVAEAQRGRVYLAPSACHEQAAAEVKFDSAESCAFVPLAVDPRNLWCQQYGLTHFSHLFTPRQLLGLEAFCDAIQEVRQRIESDAKKAGLHDDGISFEDGGVGARAYADAITLYLTLALSRSADWSNSLTRWLPHLSKAQQMFSRHAIPMGWDFVEINQLSDVGGSFLASVENQLGAFSRIPASVLAVETGCAWQADARAFQSKGPAVISTDPPYFDNISYADLSDFFYVWIRRSLRSAFPKACQTISVPKAEELVASPYRHLTKDASDQYFMSGMADAMQQIRAASHPAVPITIYYAFKQSESDGSGRNVTSTGWETFLAAVVQCGLVVCGTWPVRTEKASRTIGVGTNALASSIVLVLKPRAKSAGTISRREFVRRLNEVLPAALAVITGAEDGEHSPVAPVDLSQAMIGPGMEIFSRYDAILEADGSPMSVKTALQLINRFLAEDDFDADTQFCLSWFEQHGWEAGKFGEADILARAKGTSVDGVKQAGVADAAGGSVRLVRWKEYAADWDPSTDTRLPVWEALHQLIRAYKVKGDSGASRVLVQCAARTEAMRQLAYRLYTVCERKGWAEDARAYNEVVTSWSGIEDAAARESSEVQGQLFVEN